MEFNNSTIRINLFIPIVLYAPVMLIFTNFAITKYRSATQPPFDIEGNSYVVCPFACNSYEKEIVDESSPLKNTDPDLWLNVNDLRSRFARDVESVKTSQQIDLKLSFFFGLLALGYTIIALIIWITTKIMVKDGVIYISSVLPRYIMRLGDPTSYSPTYNWKTSKYQVINIDKITHLGIFTTTPLVPTRTDVSQINWRDRINIDYIDNNGQTNTGVVELAVFPGFKEVVENLKQQNPRFPIDFSK